MSVRLDDHVYLSVEEVMRAVAPKPLISLYRLRGPRDGAPATMVLLRMPRPMFELVLHGAQFMQTARGFRASHPETPLPVGYDLLVSVDDDDVLIVESDAAMLDVLELTAVPPDAEVAP